MVHRYTGTQMVTYKFYSNRFNIFFFKNQQKKILHNTCFHFPNLIRQNTAVIYDSQYKIQYAMSLKWVEKENGMSQLQISFIYSV